MRFITDNPARYERLKSVVRDAMPVSKEMKQKLSLGVSRWHQRHVQDFVFIHINKCGGTALERALGIPFLNHDTAAERLSALGEAEWKHRFRFVLVRNPYHRMISKYFYDDKSGLSYDKQLRAFPDFLSRLEREYADGTATRHRLPMKWWLKDSNGTVLVETFYRLEEIDSALTDISERLGRPISMRRVKDNPTRYEKNDILCSTELRQRMYALLREDFEYFGYEA